MKLAQWLEFQRGKFGVFTDFLYRLGLFEVFHSLWFAVGLGVLVVSVVVCTAARRPAIWRTITRPPKRVSDAFFEHTRERLELSRPVDVELLERVLRRRRYAVARFQEGATTYLFADRFQWAQLGTFISHLALILFIAAALVSRFTGFAQQLSIAEGASAPVFPVVNPNQMQVEVLDAVGVFNERGEPIDYRTEMVIYKRGEKVKRCTSTVNSPCTYDGYRFHQVSYFGYGAAVQVRDVNTGNVVYDEVLALQDKTPGPQIIVRDAGGNVLLDETLIPTEIIETVYGTTVVLPGDGRAFWIGVKPGASGGDWALAIFELSDKDDALRLIADGGRASAGGLDFELVGVTGIPAGVRPDFPLPPGAQPADGSEPKPALLQLGNVVFGAGVASAGGNVDVPKTKGPPTLSIIGPGSLVMNLTPGQSQTIDNYEYTFLGQREFTGIRVKKDRSDTIIWVATGLLIGGLLITFWTPRRRLWAKVTPDRTYLAGQSTRLADFPKEMQQLAGEAGVSEAAEDPGDSTVKR